MKDGDIKGAIFKNTFWLTLEAIVNNVISYFLIVAIARMLGSAGLGIYSFIFSFVGLVFMISDLGLNNMMTKEIARNYSKSRFYLYNVLGMKLLLSILSVAVMLISTFFIDQPQSVIILLWLAALVQLFWTFSFVLVSFMNSFNRMDVEAIGMIIERVIALVLGLFVLYFYHSLLLFMIVLAVASFARVTYQFIKVRTKVRLNLSFDYSHWKALLLESLPFFLTGVFLYIYFRIATVMLFLMQGDQATGLYNSAYKFIEVLALIPIILVTAVFPSMSRLFKKSKTLLNALFDRSFRYLTMLSIPITFGTYILADRFINFIYGSSFQQGAIILQILIWAELFMFTNYLIGNLFMAIDRQNFFTVSTGICALANIALNAALIPKFSYMGAAFSVVITEVINMAILTGFSRKTGIKIKLSFSLFKIIAAGILMAAAVYYLRGLYVLWTIALGALIYFALLVIFGLEKEDKALISELMERAAVLLHKNGARNK